MKWGGDGQSSQCYKFSDLVGGVSHLYSSSWGDVGCMWWGGAKISLKAAWATEPRGNSFSLADRDPSRVHLCFKFYIAPKQDYTRDKVAHVKQRIHYTTLLIINYLSPFAFKTTSQSRLYFCLWPLRFLQQFELGWRWHFSRQAPNNPRNTTFPQGCVGVIIPLQKVHSKCEDWLFSFFQFLGFIFGLNVACLWSLFLWVRLLQHQQIGNARLYKLNYFLSRWPTSQF